MNKVEQMALSEIKKKSNSMTLALSESKSHLTDIKHTLIHCGSEMTKESIGELMSALHKAISGVDASISSSNNIAEWADALSEK